MKASMYISIILLTWIFILLFIYSQRKEKFTDDKILEKSSFAFPDCSQCVRYFDTIICKCTKTSDTSSSAFLYPTDITPDINIGDIAIRNDEQNKNKTTLTTI